MNKIQNRLSLPNIFCTVTCIKSRPVITALKFHKQFLVYITRHSELYVLYFVTRICYYFSSPCINMSILFITYQLFSLKLSEGGRAIEGLNVDRTGG